MTDKRVYFVYVGFWKRVLAALIDTLFGFAMFPVTMPMLYWSMEHQTALPDLGYTIVWTALWMWLLVRFGGTPGKLIIGVRVVNQSGHFLSWSQAFRRFIFPNLLLALNQQLQLWRVVATHDGPVPTDNLITLGKILNEYGQPFATIGTILGWLIYVDIGAILVNRERRAIHDFIAGSYVITKESYDTANANDAPDDTATDSSAVTAG